MCLSAKQYLQILSQLWEIVAHITYHKKISVLEIRRTGQRTNQNLPGNRCVFKESSKYLNINVKLLPYQSNPVTEELLLVNSAHE